MIRGKSRSLRSIAKELGVSHTLLSLWLQGKRNLDPDLEARYRVLVTSSGYNNGYTSGGEFVSGKLAAEAGLEPATNRLTAGHSTPCQCIFLMAPRLSALFLPR